MATAMERLLACDREYSRDWRILLAGVDEAGRGCWAGPVMAAAVILPRNWCPPGLDDSKRLAPNRREALYRQLRAGALSWSACAVGPRVIEKKNILAATLQAMAKAVRRLDPAPDLALIDGIQTPTISCEAISLIKGDACSAAVAAASIMAKVLRDRLMVAWDRRFPGYGFADHKGYGVPAHHEALQRLGPCPIHRMTFRPVADSVKLRFWNDSC